MSTIIAYDKYKNKLDDAEQLKAWAVENIVGTYIDKLDGDYYYTGWNGWEALFQYITYEEDYSESFMDRPTVVDEEQLYKMIRLANHEFNNSSEYSKMDAHFGVGYFATEEIEESTMISEDDLYKYIISVNSVELSYPGDTIYNVTDIDFPKEIELYLNVDDAEYYDIYELVQDKVGADIQYEIDSPDYIDEVEISDIDFDIVSIDKIIRR